MESQEFTFDSYRREDPVIGRSRRHWTLVTSNVEEFLPSPPLLTSSSNLLRSTYTSLSLRGLQPLQKVQPLRGNDLHKIHLRLGSTMDPFHPLELLDNIGT